MKTEKKLVFYLELLIMNYCVLNDFSEKAVTFLPFFCVALGNYINDSFYISRRREEKDINESKSLGNH